MANAAAAARPHVPQQVAGRRACIGCAIGSGCAAFRRLRELCVRWAVSTGASCRGCAASFHWAAGCDEKQSSAAAFRPSQPFLTMERAAPSVVRMCRRPRRSAAAQDAFGCCCREQRALKPPSPGWVGRGMERWRGEVRKSVGEVGIGVAHAVGVSGSRGERSGMPYGSFGGSFVSTWAGLVFELCRH